MPDGASYQLTVDQVIGSRNLSNVLYFAQSGPDPTGTATEVELVNAFVTSVVPHWVAAMSNAWSIFGFRCREILPTPGWTYNTTSVHTGTIAQQCFPPNSVAVISQETAGAGRATRGRMYLSGIPITGGQVGVLNEPEYDLLLALAAAVIGAISGTSASYHNALYGRAAGSINLVTNAQPRNDLRNLRSRTIS